MPSWVYAVSASIICAATRCISSCVAAFVANEQHIGIRQQIEFAGAQPSQSHDRESGGSAGNRQGGLDRSLSRGGVLAQRVEDFAQLKQIARARQEHAAAVMPSQDGVRLGAVDLLLGEVSETRDRP